MALSYAQQGLAADAPLLYSFTFGGTLPMVSLLFARILGDTAEAEAASSPELTRSKQTIKELQAALDTAETRMSDTEARAIASEQRFAAAGDLFARLFAEEKRLRVLAAYERCPELPAESIATLSSQNTFGSVFTIGNPRSQSATVAFSAF